MKYMIVFLTLLITFSSMTILNSQPTQAYENAVIVKHDQLKRNAPIFSLTSAQMVKNIFRNKNLF